MPNLEEYCAITRGGDADFPMLRTSVMSFIDKNRWFTGKIIILTDSTRPINSSNLNVLRQIHPNLEKMGVSQGDSLRSILRLIDSKGSIYFSNRVLFFGEVSNLLHPSCATGITGEDPNDPDLAFFPKSVMDQEEIEFINPKINSVRSSQFVNSRYANFISKSKTIDAIIMDTFSIPESSGFSKIHAHWRHANSKYQSTLRIPVKTDPSKIRRARVNTSLPNSYTAKNTEVKVSIIIPAYRADGYIEECLTSIQNQDCENEIEILIGIDNCQVTLNKLKSIKDNYSNLKVYFSDESVGPYIIRNSLIELASNDCIIFFDADDIMSNGLVSTVTGYYNEDHPVRFKYYNFNHGSDPNKFNKIHHDVAHGVFMCSKKILDRIGGFQPWICGADSEFMKRCSANGIRETRIDIPLFYRRIHPKSLTQSGQTNHRSRIRLEKQRFIKTNRDWSIPITRKKVSLEEI
jgi:hypothetical protein